MLGVHPQTVARWARQGAIVTAARTAGGHRRYARAEVDRLLKPSTTESGLSAHGRDKSR